MVGVVDVLPPSTGHLSCVRQSGDTEKSDTATIVSSGTGLDAVDNGALFVCLFDFILNALCS